MTAIIDSVVGKGIDRGRGPSHWRLAALRWMRRRCPTRCLL